MAQLVLSIKQKYFDKILSGEKKDEHREIRPKNADKYCDFDADGFLVGPKKYDTIKLLTGAYENKRDYLIAEIISSEIILFDDEETGEPLTYIVDGEEYIESEIIYHLGAIISKQIY